MKKFANLLEQLLFTYSTNRKIEILATYLKSLNYKEKGITIAILTGSLNFKNIKRSNFLNIVKSKLDWYLFEQSYDYVGDLAETISLIWPTNGNSKQKDLNKIVYDLKNSKSIKNNGTYSEKFPCALTFLSNLFSGTFLSILKIFITRSAILLFHKFFKLYFFVLIPLTTVS